MTLAEPFGGSRSRRKDGVPWGKGFTAGDSGLDVCAVTGARPSCWAQSRAGPEGWGQLPKWGEVLRWEQSVSPATLRPAARVPGGHLCAC